MSGKKQTECRAQMEFWLGAVRLFSGSGQMGGILTDSACRGEKRQDNLTTLISDFSFVNGCKPFEMKINCR